MIKVLSSGFYTTIQDLGRVGYGSMGIPMSGAMDIYSAKLSNFLLNNDLNKAVLEVVYGGCKLLFEEEAILSITGADFSAKINNNEVAMNSALLIEKGSVLSFGKRMYGVRTYIGVKGGVLSEEVLGSRSLYKGITSSFKITKGVELPIAHIGKAIEKKFSRIKIDKSYIESKVIKCSEGPEFDLLSKQEKMNLFRIIFTISSDNNRMGYRLEEKLSNNLPSMLTSAVLPGTVQLTPSGTLIVLMKDGQVTGGYPRVLQVTEDGISKLAQKTTGDSFQFKI
ncbi:biotin-dependent carboxyltransferase family protein [Tenacibaculum sp. nBUS_03]|uniref:5-oxoprolinase subunit C family protein n=1 Tax=Tenacibaculum sp. nBUS_03 TaxID=3395320 RepID=UPI003EC0306E